MSLLGIIHETTWYKNLSVLLISLTVDLIHLIRCEPFDFLLISCDEIPEMLIKVNFKIVLLLLTVYILLTRSFKSKILG